MAASNASRHSKTIVESSTTSQNLQTFKLQFIWLIHGMSVIIMKFLLNHMMQITFHNKLILFRICCYHQKKMILSAESSIGKNEKYHAICQIQNV